MPPQPQGQPSVEQKLARTARASARRQAPRPSGGGASGRAVGPVDRKRRDAGRPVREHGGSELRHGHAGHRVQDRAGRAARRAGTAFVRIGCHGRSGIGGRAVAGRGIASVTRRRWHRSVMKVVGGPPRRIMRMRMRMRMCMRDLRRPASHHSSLVPKPAAHHRGHRNALGRQGQHQQANQQQSHQPRHGLTVAHGIEPDRTEGSARGMARQRMWHRFACAGRPARSPGCGPGPPADALGADGPGLQAGGQTSQRGLHHRLKTCEFFWRARARPQKASDLGACRADPLRPAG